MNQTNGSMNRVLRGMLFAVLILGTASAYAGGLSNFNGKPRTIADYTGHGKWLVVMIWAHDCAVCNRDVGQEVAFYERHRKKDATVLGISLDGKEYHKQAVDFIHRHKVTFPNLIGEPEDVAALYTEYTGNNWVGTPTFLIFDPNGKIRAEQVGATSANLIEKFIESNGKS
jgi:peroxiredoxin